MYVIDGYDDLENFHINWGWDGSSNGYYSLGNFLTFNDYEQMILQINPDYEATDDWQKLNLTDGSGGSYMNGGELDPIIIDFEDLEKGKDYTVTYPCILIDRDAEFTEVILALTNKEGTIKESWPVWSIEEKLINDNPPGSNLQISTSIRISSNLEPTDCLSLFYKDKNHSEFTSLRMSSFLKSSYPVVGNTPKYINTTYDIDSDVDFTLYYGGQSFTDIHKLPTKVTKGSTINIQGRSVNGYPVFYYNGELKLYGGNDNPSESFVGFTMTEDATIKIENVKFSDLIDLNIHLDSPGTLSEKISQEQAPFVNSLNITGTFNADDLWYINKQLPVIRKLDLSNALISEENKGRNRQTLWGEVLAH